MAVREFTDSTGVEWRVWDVTPQHMHPATRSEDYMGNLQDGWLVFESGRDKRRLEAPYPANWTDFSLGQLEQLCRRAAPVVKRAQTNTGQQRASTLAAVEVDAMQQAHAQRVFRSPGGREWTVRIHECLDRAGDEQMVLRFTAEDIVVELSRWPADWQTATVERFGLMLLDANPPRRRPKGEGPQRRRDDRVSLGDQPPPSSPAPDRAR
jgi:hypothetical protein